MKFGNEMRFKDYLICRPEVVIDSKLTENIIFVRGTGKILCSNLLN